MERFWRPSVEVAQSSEHLDMFPLVEQMHQNGDVDEIIRSLDRWDEDDESPLDTIARELCDAASELNLTPSDIRYLQKLLAEESEDSGWSYGETSLDGTLFESSAPAIKRQTVSTEDLYVLSGLAGYYLKESVPKKLASRLESTARSPHEQRQLLGSMALSVEPRYTRLTPSFPRFHSFSRDRIDTFVEVGGDFNGDFRLLESYEFASAAIDPTGDRRDYAPAIPGMLIAGYHSIEPSLLLNIIHDQLERGGKARATQFASNVLALLANETPDFKAGNFGDYGDDDEHAHLFELNRLLSGEEVYIQDSFLVHPGSNLRLNVLRSGDGLRISNAREDEVTEHTIEIPSDKIEDFCFRLVQSSYNFGRTSPKTLIHLLSTVATEAL